MSAHVSHHDEAAPIGGRISESVHHRPGAPRRRDALRPGHPLHPRPGRGHEHERRLPLGPVDCVRRRGRLRAGRERLHRGVHHVHPQPRGLPPHHATRAAHRALRLRPGGRLGLLRHRPLLERVAHLRAPLHAVRTRCCSRSRSASWRTPSCCSSSSCPSSSRSCAGPKARRRLERVLFFFIAVGVLLPTMHQSSLGSLLVIFGPRWIRLYQTNLLPLLFLSSTIGMGLAAVVVEGAVTSVALRRPLERQLARSADEGGPGAHGLSSWWSASPTSSSGAPRRPCFSPGP